MKREREDAARDIDELAADAIEGLLDEKKEHPGTLATIYRARAIELLEWCAEEYLPPPNNLIQLIKHTLNDPPTLTDYLLQDVRGTSNFEAWHKATEFEADYPPDPTGKAPSTAPLNGTANQVGVDRKDIRRFRDHDGGLIVNAGTTPKLAGKNTYWHRVHRLRQRRLGIKGEPPPAVDLAKWEKQLAAVGGDLSEFMFVPITFPALKALCKSGYSTIEALADLSSDELRELLPKRQRPSMQQANHIIMAARHAVGMVEGRKRRGRPPKTAKFGNQAG